MKSMLVLMREYLAAFGMPQQKSALALQRCKLAVQSLSAFFESMATEIGKRSKKGLTGEGPDGNVSRTNRGQLQLMLEGMDIITTELELLEHNKLLEKVSAAVVQEFVCELFFTDMRK